MTTCKEINELLDTKDLEKIKVEFKQSEEIRMKEGQKDLAKELVALANHLGGRLIIGLTDDGKFEGKDIFKVDNDKGIINNIIQSRISPTLNYNIEFLQCPKGDLLIIHVEKRKDIPHAYIVSKESHEIKNRIYYIKTPHDKRLLSDMQLKYLFKEQSLDFSHPFSIVINYTKPEFKIPYKINMPYGVGRYLMSFINALSDDYLEILKQKGLNIEQFNHELISYFLLYSIFSHFTFSWDIRISASGSSRRTGAYVETPKEEFSSNNFPEFQENSAFKALSIDRGELFSFPFNKFFLPPNTKFEIGKHPNVIKIYNDIVEIDISYYSMSGGVGMEPSHPYIGKYTAKPLFESQELYKKFNHIRMNFMLHTNIKFPIEDINYFDAYSRLVENVRKIIDDEWNFDEYVNTLPNYMFFKLEEKLDILTNLVREKKDI